MSGPGGWTPGEEGGALSAAQLARLAELAQAVSGAAGLPQLAARLAQTLGWLVDFDQLALAMRAADGRTWALVRPRLGPATDPAWLELRDPDSALEEALRRGAPVVVTGPANHLLPPGFEASAPIVELSIFPSAVAVPLAGPDGPLGALGVFCARPRAYGPSQVPLLSLLGALVESCARRLVALEELGRADRELTRADRLRAELSELLVHDLRNPLASVESGLDQLLAGALPAAAGPGARAVVEEARTAAALLSGLVGDLLEVARLEDGRLVAARRRVEVAGWLRDRAAGQAARARAGGVQLSSRAEPAELAAEFDPLLLGRVVDNLLANAVRHTPTNGQVAVVARASPGGVTIAVADTGPGIPEAHRPRLFTKYGRVVDGPAPMRGGGGLGLYFCKLAVELHGGTIRAEEAPGGGALFRILLPPPA